MPHTEDTKENKRLCVDHNAAKLGPPFNMDSLPREILLTDWGTSLKLGGMVEEALTKYLEAIAINPKYAPAYYNIGVVKSEQGKFQEALHFYFNAVQCNPVYAEGYCNIGVIHKNAGNLAGAIEFYSKALAINQNFVIGRNNMAIAMTDMGTKVKSDGNLVESIKYYKKALTFNSMYPDAYYNLGVAYGEKCDFEKALVCYELAVHFNPCFCEAYNNMGVIHKDRDNFERAIQCYQAALAANPNFSQTLNNLGVIFTIQGKFEEAIKNIKSAIDTNPAYAEAYNNLGVLYRDEGLIDEAIHAYEQCLAISPLSRNAGQNRLLALNYLSTAGDAILEENFQKHEQWGELFSKQFSQIAQWSNDRNPDRPLRIGYISPDFFTHSVSYFVEALLANHNKSSFEIFCYSNVLKEDSKTQLLRSYGHTWRQIYGHTAAHVVELIQEDKIDILVELAGHTAGNRLDVTAIKPAPILITYIGYPNTTGLKTIDYRIIDSFTDPIDTKQKFTETLWRMSKCFLCYTPVKDPPQVAEAPCIKNGFVTFGSFNNLAKITDQVLKTWAKILLEVPYSKLLMKCKPFTNQETKNRVLKIFEDMGVPNSRLELVPLIPICFDHLKCYDLMDLSLDPWPYAGTTTTCESIFMGVPVVTLEGTNHAWNVGKSLLMQVQLQELIAKTEQEYIDIAIKLGSNPLRLQQLRENLRPNMLASPLCQGKAFTAELEEAYSTMWKKWCEGSS